MEKHKGMAPGGAMPLPFVLRDKMSSSTARERPVYFLDLS